MNAEPCATNQGPTAVVTAAAYRRGLRRALAPFQFRVRSSSVLKARLLLSIPCERTIDELADDLGSNHVTVGASLRSLRKDGLIVRTRLGGRGWPSRYELTPEGEAIFLPPQPPRSAVPTPGSAQRRPADPADAVSGQSAC